MRIIRVGIKRVVAQKKYHAGQESLELLEKAGIKVDIIDNTTLEYAKQ